MRATIFTLLLLCSMSARAQPTVENCEQPGKIDSEGKSSAGWAACVYYLEGMVVMDKIHLDVGATPMLGCVPSEASGEQLRRVLVRYIREHPEHRHHNVVMLAILAFRDAWPCE